MDGRLVSNYLGSLEERVFSGGRTNELWAVYIPSSSKKTPLLTEQLTSQKIHLNKGEKDE